MAISGRLTQKNTIKHKLIFRCKLAGILSLKEHDYNALLQTIEHDALFGALLKTGVVRYDSRKRFGLASDILEFDDNIFHHTSDNSDISGIIDSNKDLLPILRKIGIDKFKTYFYENDEINAESIASALSIPLPTVKRIVSLLNDVSLFSEFFHPSKIYQHGVSFTKIAKIDIEKGRLIFGYYSMDMAQGTYLIDNDKLHAFNNSLTDDKKEHLNEILSSLKIFNAKKTMLYCITETLLKVQRDYFLSNQLSALNVFSAKDLSLELKISQSSISRAICARSVVTPQNTEISIQSLLPHKMDVIKYILSASAHKYSHLNDRQLMEELAATRGIRVSRRMICKCRNELA